MSENNAGAAAPGHPIPPAGREAAGGATAHWIGRAERVMADTRAESGIGVNSFLWRASLDTLNFMPLASADPFGGVIITDWYSPPAAQGERFDPTGAYVRRWLPELRDVPDELVHRPWEAPMLAPEYAARVVLHEERRIEALRRFEEARQRGGS